MLDYPLEGMVVVADSAQQHKLTDKTELTELAESWQRRRDTRALRVAVRLSDGRAANGGETLGRIVVFWRNGLPRPELQFRVDGPRGQLAFTDYVWEDYGVVGEFDGKRKYLRDVDPDRLGGGSRRGGVAGEAARGLDHRVRLDRTAACVRRHLPTRCGGRSSSARR